MHFFSTDFSLKKILPDSAASLKKQHKWLDAQELRKLNAKLLASLTLKLKRFIIFTHGKKAMKLSKREIVALQDVDLRHDLMVAHRELQKNKHLQKVFKADSLRNLQLQMVARDYQELLCTLLFISIGCQRRGTLMVMFVDSFEQVKEGALKGWTLFNVGTEKNRRLHGSKVPIHPTVSKLIWFWINSMRPFLLKSVKETIAIRAKGKNAAISASRELEDVPYPTDPETLFISPRNASWASLNQLSTWVKKSIKACLGKEYNLSPLQLRRIMPSLIWQRQLHLKDATPEVFMSQYASLVNSSAEMMWKHYVRVTDENLYAKVVQQIDEGLLQSVQSKAVSAELSKVLRDAESEPDVVILDEDKYESALLLENEELALKNQELEALQRQDRKESLSQEKATKSAQPAEKVQETSNCNHGSNLFRTCKFRGIIDNHFFRGRPRK